MAWLGDREFWVNLIGYASIASAAIFGLLALFTDYKKDGRITRWGRLYAGGIAMSAVFAMTSSVLQKRIAADAAAAGEAAAKSQRDEQQRRFNTQLGHLQRLNGQMEFVSNANQRLIHDMTSSLATQGRLLTRAQEGMLLTSRLGVQERANTGRVLHRLWDESTKVTGNTISVWVTYVCAPVEPGREFPRLLAQNAVAQLSRVGPSSRLGGDFLSFDQDVSVHRSRGTGGDRVLQYSKFRAFLPQSWGNLERPENWEDMDFVLNITGFQPGLVADVDALMPGKEAGGVDALAPGLEPPAWTRANGVQSMRVLPCSVVAALFINGRPLAGAGGSLIQIREDEADSTGRVAVVFSPMHTRQSVFPRFVETAPAPPSAPAPWLTARSADSGSPPRPR